MLRQLPQICTASAMCGSLPFEGIRAGLELALEDDGYREASRRISDEMRALPAIDGFLASVIDQPG